MRRVRRPAVIGKDRALGPANRLLERMRGFSVPLLRQEQCLAAAGTARPGGKQRHTAHAGVAGAGAKRSPGELPSYGLLGRRAARPAVLLCALVLAAAGGCTVSCEQETELVPASEVLDLPDQPRAAQATHSAEQSAATRASDQSAATDAADSSAATDSADQSAALDAPEAVLLRVGKNPLGGCDLCHVDVADQYTPSAHFTSPEDKVGCADCHGPSDGHVRDENNEVPPDRAFATAEEVNGFCVTCHECERPRESDTPATAKLSCTDCHQAHTLARIEPEKDRQ